ncbi:MAG: excisionase family DNA-binding protein [Acidimicrobiia bacterium]|nr:excisionase family DNA-binding protein [Acidimicrobiia bacterium]
MDIADAAARALPDGRVVVIPTDKQDEPVSLPESIVSVLAEILDHARRGEHVRVIADDEEITTQQAADLLNVSRPYLVGLVDQGKSRHAKSVRAAPEIGRRIALPRR